MTRGRRPPPSSPPNRADRALRARMGARPGRQRLRRLRARRGAFQPDARTGDGVRGEGQPGLSRRRLRSQRRHGRGPAQGRGRLPQRRRSRLGRQLRLPVLRRRRVLPAGLRQRRCAGLAAGARRHAAAPAGGREGGRRRLRRRFLHPVDGRGFPEQQLRRLRLPRPVDRTGERPCPVARPCRPGQLRDRRGQGDRRARLRPHHHVRLPARHGRSAGMRGADAQAPEAGRRLDDRRAHRGRPCRATMSPTRSAGSTTTPRR